MPKRPDYISQTKLADILGVSRQAVQKLCKPGGKYEPALNDKRKINRNHPIVDQHIKEKREERSTGNDPIQKPEPGEKKPPSIIPPQVKNQFNLNVTYEDLKHLTLKEFVEDYGGIPGFKGYVDSLVKMTDWKTREDKYRKNRNELIEKEPTAKALFAIINLAFSRLVNEHPVSIADQIIAIVKSEKETARMDVIELMRSTLSKIIKDAKKELVRDLKRLD
jgi:hypothetical protein